MNPGNAISTKHSLPGTSREGKIFHYANTPIQIQSTLVISNSKGPSETLQDIRASTCQIFIIEEKIIRKTTFNKFICNWTLDVNDIWKILWKRGEIRSNFSSFPQYFLLVVHVVMFRKGQDFHFEISGYSR